MSQETASQKNALCRHTRGSHATQENAEERSDSALQVTLGKSSCLSADMGWFTPILSGLYRTECSNKG